MPMIERHAFIFLSLRILKNGSWLAWNNLNLKAIRQSPGVFYAAPLMARRGGGGYLDPKISHFSKWNS